MQFNSYTYIGFLLIVWGVYFVLRRRERNLMLLAASYFFYGSWSVKFLSLILISTVVDFFCGRAIHRTEDPKRRKRILLVSLCSNLGMLGVFKYYDFFATSFSELAGTFGLEVSPATLGWVLPVGISFYTFQTLTYTIDIYRRQLEPTNNFFDFALFVAFFPQLVAGPIERAGKLLPQLIQDRLPSLEQLRHGLWLILLGLFKKAVIADNVALIANNVFESPAEHSGLYVLVGIYAFAFQIYCDFSGYTDVARGTAKLFGIDLMLNFHMPYLATSPQDFWRRWHISLSTWLRDYLYIPLGGSRRGSVYANLAITMLLGGLWHGAAMHFVVWGAFQGAMLAIHRRFTSVWASFGEAFASRPQLWWALRVGFMFQLTCVGWVIFRANTMADAWTVLTSVFELAPLTAPQAKDLVILVYLCLPLMVMHVFKDRSGDVLFIHNVPRPVRMASLAYCGLMLFFWAAHEEIPFIYFQF